MNEGYGHVGRPTNEEVNAKKRKKKLMIGIPLVAVVALVGAIASQNGLWGLMGNTVTENCPNSSWKLENNNVCRRTLETKNAGSVTATKYIKGDVNKNGTFDTSDAVQLNSMINRGYKFNEFEKKLYDLDDSGIVDNNDLDGLLVTTNESKIKYEQKEIYGCPETFTNNSSYVIDSGNFKDSKVSVTTKTTYRLDGKKCLASSTKVEEVDAKFYTSLGSKTGSDSKNGSVNNNTNNNTNNNNNNNAKIKTDNNKTNTNTNNNSAKTNTTTETPSSHYTHQTEKVTKSINIKLIISVPQGFSDFTNTNLAYKRKAKVTIYNSMSNCENKTNSIASHTFPSYDASNSGQYIFNNITVEKDTRIYVRAEKLSDYYSGVAGAIIEGEGTTTNSTSECIAVRALTSSPSTVKIGFTPKVFNIYYLNSSGSKITNSVVRKYVDQDSPKIIDLAQTKVSKGKTKKSTGWRAYRIDKGKTEYFCKTNEWSANCKEPKKFVVGNKLNINSPSSDIMLEPIDYK